MKCVSANENLSADEKIIDLCSLSLSLLSDDHCIERFYDRTLMMCHLITSGRGGKFFRERERER